MFCQHEHATDTLVTTSPRISSALRSTRRNEETADKNRTCQSQKTTDNRQEWPGTGTSCCSFPTTPHAWDRLGFARLDGVSHPRPPLWKKPRGSTGTTTLMIVKLKTCDTVVLLVAVSLLKFTGLPRQFRSMVWLVARRRGCPVDQHSLLQFSEALRTNASATITREASRDQVSNARLPPHKIWFKRRVFNGIVHA